MITEETTDIGPVFLGREVVQSSAAATDRYQSRPADPNIGRRLGPYRLERLLARGGMGVVYVAVREDDYEQKVAVKLISPERLSLRGLDRFYRERQILARLEHPNVARLLDGGTNDEALPYLVMEFVEGEPIDFYCESRQIPLRRRLELFRTVCEAVHFAHQNLIVHRDLKPANVLVAQDGVVKLLDFGIAKLLAPEAPQTEANTVAGKAPMTPTYASPEQLEGRVISTASDVYSLGVLLCKMLTDRLPYELAQGGTAHMVEAICRRDAKRPSELVADRTLRRRLTGDVDAIASKALRKEPEARYASALQIAEDVRRHLESLPVKAHDGDLFYFARKLARRHRVAAAILALIVVFSITATWLWRQAVEQRVRAEQSLLEAERVSTFLQELFRTADPNVARGKPPSIREALDRSRAQLLGGELEEAPEVRAELLATLGTVYNDLGYFDEARQLKREALRVRREADPSDRPDLASDLNNLGRLLYDGGDFAAAEQRFRDAVAMWRRLEATADQVTGLSNLAAAVMQQGRYDEALERHREILGLQRGLGAGDVELGASLYSLGTLHRLRGETAEAEDLLRRALDAYQRAFGSDDTRVAAVQSSLGRVLHVEGRRPEARQLYEQALDVRIRLLGEDHLKVAVTRGLLAELLLDDGETAAAGEILEAALDDLRRTVAPGDARLATAESVWGSYLAALGRDAEAETVLLASYQVLRNTRGKNAAERGAARRLVAFYAARGRDEEAAAYRAAASPELSESSP
ncbi:MAG: serine/threonine-protein kinase [Holophagales bacterium]|nr:serine/threonine-protein kinase [Holophagales bacterium]